MKTAPVVATLLLPSHNDGLKFNVEESSGTTGCQPVDILRA